MKSLIDRAGALSKGLDDIRLQFSVPGDFPAAALSEAEAAAGRAILGRSDWTDRPFATLDPASSQDLDQAFLIERAGNDLILHYAIADVGWFIAPGGALDGEAWKRGTTIYMPDRKASLYPGRLSEKAASLLPDVDRPCVIFSVKIDQSGKASLDGASRAMIRSKAKLAYESVTIDDLGPDFTELSRRIEQAESARGAMRVDAPEQELVVAKDGQFSLEFRPQLDAERQNASLSLAANLAIADTLLAHHTGLFRIMAAPDPWAINRLRHSAKALGLIWPKNATLEQFETGLDASEPRQAAFQTAVRRAGPGAAYTPDRGGVIPWHFAMGATYSHATAPLRRLADRYVIEAALQLALGGNVSSELSAMFDRLPAVMARAEEKAGQVDRATLDLAEAVMLEGSEGSKFSAVVTDVDERGARIQLSDPAVVTRIDPKGAMPGDLINVELVSTDIVHRQVRFTRVAS